MEATRDHQCSRCESRLYAILIDRQTGKIAGVECDMCGNRQSLDEISSAARPPELAAGDPALPGTPATAGNLAAWASGALRLAPYVDTPQADPEEHGSILMVAAMVSGAAVQIVLGTGQVFRLDAVELTRTTGDPAHPFTLNPAGQVFTHASLDGAPLCGPGAEGGTASPRWGEVTCLDCQLAAPAAAAGALDNLDIMFAKRQIRDALTVAAPSPLTAYELMVRADPDVRAAVPEALNQMAGHGDVERADAGDGRPGWQLARPLAG
jgi:hypothetical protein